MTALSDALRIRKTSAIIAAASGTIVALAATLVLSRPAGALPAAQSSCTVGSIAITPASGWVPLTPPISVTVTANDDRIKAEVTADVGVDAGAEVRLGWSSLGAPPLEGRFGPANFANHQEFFETRTTFALFFPGSGPATVQPYVRVNGPSGATATLLHRCVTAESQTS